MNTSFNYVISMIFTTIFVVSVSAQTVDVQIQLVTYCVNNTKLKYAQVGISVKDLKNDSVVAGVSANKNMIPASLVKSYTSAASL